MVRIPPGHFIEVQRCNLLSYQGGDGGVARYEGLLKYGGCVSTLGGQDTARVVGLLCGVSMYEYSSYNKGVIPRLPSGRAPSILTRVEYWGVRLGASGGFHGKDLFIVPGGGSFNGGRLSVGRRV